MEFEINEMKKLPPFLRETIVICEDGAPRSTRTTCISYIHWILLNVPHYLFVLDM